MSDYLPYLLPVAAYFYGAIPFGLLLTRAIKGVDLRELGSGNIGATNAARCLGGKFFPFIFLLDFSKGFIPTLLAVLLVGSAGPRAPSGLAVLTGVAAVAGHVFPVYLGFKGGKGVATSSGVFVVLAPWAFVIALCVWLVVFVIWRYVSLASMCAASALLIAVWMSPERLGERLYLTVLGTVGALLVISLHHENIRRLLRGTESKMDSKPNGREKAGQPEESGQDI